MKSNRSILLLLLANSISGVSQGISMLAIPWFFAHLIQRANLFSAIYFIVTAISLGWGVYAGALVDRYSRKNLFVAMNTVGLLLVGVVSIMGFAMGGLSWAAVAIVFASTVFIYNIHFPALYAFAQEITPKEQYAKVTSQLEVQGQITWTISGGLAAVLLNGWDFRVQLFGTGFQWHVRPLLIHEVFAIDAVTYFIALLIIWQIKALPQEPRDVDMEPVLKRIRTGLGFLKRHPILFVFGNASLFVFLTIIVHSTLVNPIYVENFLQRGANVYALADMYFSLGALLAGLYTARLVHARYAKLAIVVLSIAAAMLYTCHVWNTALWLYFGSYLLIGACNSGIRVLRITYLFSHIPNHIIGRAGSVFFVINVALRLLVTGLFALPLFHNGGYIAWANAVLAGICATGGIVIWLLRNELDGLH